jgi:hypothetical protein
VSCTLQHLDVIIFELERAMLAMVDQTDGSAAEAGGANSGSDSLVALNDAQEFPQRPD